MNVESLATTASSVAAEPFVQPLLAQIGFNRMVFHLNVDGITHEESLRSPAPAGNCLNWVVGHLVAARQRWLAAVLGMEPAMDPARFALYVRGSAPLAGDAQAIRLEELVAGFDASQERLLAGLGRLTPARMAEPAPFSPGNDASETIGSLCAKLAFHEAYHTGQTGILRRLLGHAGGIA